MKQAVDIGHLSHYPEGASWVKYGGGEQIVNIQKHLFHSEDWQTLFFCPVVTKLSVSLA
jgi:hypothetical protein